MMSIVLRTEYPKTWQFSNNSTTVNILQLLVNHPSAISHYPRDSLGILAMPLRAASTEYEFTLFTGFQQR